MRERVVLTIAEHLGVDVDEVTDAAGFVDDLGVDSLDSVELVMAFEKEFEREIPDGDAESAITVGDAVRYFEAKVCT